jgi:hypothetical protein
MDMYEWHAFLHEKALPQRKSREGVLSLSNFLDESMGLPLFVIDLGVLILSTLRCWSFIAVLARMKAIDKCHPSLEAFLAVAYIVLSP